MKPRGNHHHTRAELRRLKGKLKGKLPQSTLSRLLSGASWPSFATLYAILALLDSEDAGKLMVAYLTDCIPEELRGRVIIKVRYDRDAEWQLVIRKLKLLRPEHRALVEQLIHALLNPESAHAPVIRLSGEDDQVDSD